MPNAVLKSVEIPQRPPLKAIVAFVSLQGERSRNEDACTVFETPFGHVLAVADGLGGHPHGDKASRAAVDALPDVLRAHDDWDRAYAALDQVVRSTFGSTTMTVLVLNLHERRFTLSWCGDSPGLHIAADGLVIAAVKPHGVGCYVLRCLGGNRHATPCTPDVLRGFVHAGDIFLLASDGLDELLDDGEADTTIPKLIGLVKSALKQDDPERALLHVCITLANEAIQDRRCEDNTTVAIAAIVEG